MNASEVPSLGTLEATIMRVLWQRPNHTSVRRVLAALEPERAYTTVMTVMGRLRAQVLLQRRRAGRGWMYRPAMSCEAYAAAATSEALAVAEDRASALLHFVADPDQAGANTLRRLLGVIE